MKNCDIEERVRRHCSEIGIEVNEAGYPNGPVDLFALVKNQQNCFVRIIDEEIELHSQPEMIVGKNALLMIRTLLTGDER